MSIHGNIITLFPLLGLLHCHTTAPATRERASVKLVFSLSPFFTLFPFLSTSFLMRLASFSSQPYAHMHIHVH